GNGSWCLDRVPVGVSLRWVFWTGGEAFLCRIVKGGKLILGRLVDILMVFYFLIGNFGKSNDDLCSVSISFLLIGYMYIA
ncbi:hypothetical protein, partial [Exiguobacterium sp. KRL4]|uniref:hypothetical protein n=1 Tax=Exiguobacterium sp. KRL4 TaxID=1914536 RepID=UPI001F3E2E7E